MTPLPLRWICRLRIAMQRLFRMMMQPCGQIALSYFLQISKIYHLHACAFCSLSYFCWTWADHASILHVSWASQYSSSSIYLCIFLSHILMLTSAHSFEYDHMAVLCACVHFVQATAWPVGIIVRSHESCNVFMLYKRSSISQSNALQIFESLSLFTTNVVFI